MHAEEMHLIEVGQVKGPSGDKLARIDRFGFGGMLAVVAVVRAQRYVG